MNIEIFEKQCIYISNILLETCKALDIIVHYDILCKYHYVTLLLNFNINK